MAKLFCISDAHLGAQEPELEQLKKEKLTSFLNYVLQEDGELIINGDLFDFWFEYRHAVPRQHFQILAQLSNFVNTGKKFTILPAIMIFGLILFSKIRSASYFIGMSMN